MQLLRDNLTLWTSDLQDSESQAAKEQLVLPYLTCFTCLSAPQDKEEKPEEAEAPAPTGAEAA